MNNPNISIHQLTFTALLALVWLFSGSFKIWKIVLSALLMPLLAFTGNGFFLAAAFAAFSSLMFFKNHSPQRFWWLAPIGSAGLALVAYLQTANYKALDCAGIPMETPIYYLSFVKGLVLNGLVISYPGGFFKWWLFVVLILLGSWVTFRILRYARQAKEMVPLLIVGYVVLFFAATLMGRWCYGPLITESSRYLPQAALAFMAFGLFNPGIKTWRTAAWGFFSL
ncbi:MAG: hypothetical protein U5L96_15060 [Owenweeksia sp.]|nr:hypothetical protein [Owenweeksia sp.]